MKHDKRKLANNPTMDDDYLFAASTQDCTGLIPSVAHDETEAENYEELYPYLPVTPGFQPARSIISPDINANLPLSAGFPPDKNHLL